MPSSKPRGFFQDLSFKKWAKDTSLGYYDTFELKIMWPAIKSIALISIYYFWIWLTCWHMAMMSCVFSVFFYQRIIACFVPNTIVIPSMDCVTFMSNNKAHTNYMNQSQYDVHQPEVLLYKFKKMIKTMPKFRYKIK